MFGSSNNNANTSKFKTAKVETIVGVNTEFVGNIKFVGGLHIDGKVKGNITAEEGSDSILILSEHGVVEGEVTVPNVLLNGTVTGDVHALARVELANNAKVNGNVYYALLEMAMGAAINGNLVHENVPQEKRVLEHQSKERQIKERPQMVGRQ